LSRKASPLGNILDISCEDVEIEGLMHTKLYISDA
jgi:hypothetical protein